jgi:hypothetical protein
MPSWFADRYASRRCVMRSASRARPSPCLHQLLEARRAHLHEGELGRDEERVEENEDERESR